MRRMPGTNLTREEAQTRAGLVSVDSYSVELDLTTGPWGGQIVLSDIAASGSDQSSMWFVGWGPDTVYGIFPKGQRGGLEQEDLGKQLIFDSGGANKFTAWVTHYKWNVGICVSDARYLVRPKPRVATDPFRTRGPSRSRRGVLAFLR